MNDKLKHFLASAAITLLTLTFFVIIQHGYLYGYDKLIALTCGIFAGAVKEFVWDKWMGRGMFEWRDLEASLYGSYVAMFAWIIIETVVLAFIKA